MQEHKKVHKYTYLHNTNVYFSIPQINGIGKKNNNNVYLYMYMHMGVHPS